MLDPIDLEKQIDDWLAQLRLQILEDGEEWSEEEKWNLEDDDSTAPSQETYFPSDSFAETSNANSDRTKEVM